MEGHGGHGPLLNIQFDVIFCLILPFVPYRNVKICANLQDRLWCLVTYGAYIFVCSDHYMGNLA